MSFQLGLEGENVSILNKFNDCFWVYIIDDVPILQKELS